MVSSQGSRIILFWVSSQRNNFCFPFFHDFSVLPPPILIPTTTISNTLVHSGRKRNVSLTESKIGNVVE